MNDIADGLDDLKAELRERIEPLAEALFGSPNRALSNRRELRFGSKGSLAVVIDGPKRGCWFDHEADTGGHELGLIRHRHRSSGAEAVAWARTWTGSSDRRRIYQPPPRRPEQVVRDNEAAADKASRIRIARQLWQASIPISGPAAVYLTSTRAIPEPANGWPSEVVRYHYASRSLILAATLADGTLQAVQRVRLTSEGRKIEGPGRRAKQTDGILTTGAVVRLPGNANGPLLLAEGPETGLSAWAATQHETWIALGTVAKIVPPTGRRVVLCADDDPRHATKGESNNAHQTRTKAIASWRSAGRDVAVVYPWPERRQDKSDFNNLIQIGGVQAVHARISLALNPNPSAMRRVPVADTRTQLNGLVQWFFNEAPLWVPPSKDEEKGWPAPEVIATNPGVAAGKSAAAQRHAVRMLIGLRARDDHRNVAIATPLHALNLEQAARIMALPEARAAGLVVRVWHGRKRADPAQPGKAMCHDLEAIRDAQDAGLDPQEAVCGSDDVRCPFADQCGYQKQREQHADIWLVAHQLLFNRKPGALGTLAAVVIDEGFMQAGLTGIDPNDQHALTVDTLRSDVEIPGDIQKTADINSINRENGWPEIAAASTILNSARRKLVAAIQASPDGSLTRLELKRAQLTQIEAETAASLTRQRNTKPDIWPGMPKAQRRAAVEATQGRRATVREAALWDRIAIQLVDDGPEVSGWAALAEAKTDQGQIRVIHMKGRRQVRQGWRVPTLILDATLQPELVQPFYPQMRFEPVTPTAAPFMRITQVTDKAFAKTGLVQKPGYETPEARRRNRNLVDLRGRIILEARTVAPGHVLVVLQKDVEAALLALGDLPANVKTGHHNALRGRNDYEHVRLLIVVGRTQPSPAAVEELAEALSGRAVTPIAGWYPQVDAIRETAGGTELISADQHPDPLAEAIRWQKCEGELIQLIGRGRGVNRTADDPLDVLVLTDVPLPLPIDRTISAQDVKPTIRETQLAEGGAAFETPAHALKAYPRLWPSLPATRLAFHREGTEKSATNPNKGSLFGECSTLLRVAYQLAGQGQRSAVVQIDRSIIPDPKTYLEACLGPLAHCNVIPMPEQASESATVSPAIDPDTLPPAIPTPSEPVDVPRPPVPIASAVLSPAIPPATALPEPFVLLPAAAHVLDANAAADDWWDLPALGVVVYGRPVTSRARMRALPAARTGYRRSYGLDVSHLRYLRPLLHRPGFRD